MSKSSISHIFGGEGKVKVMRLFIFNPDRYYTLEEVAKKTKERPDNARKELTSLIKAGMIKKRVKSYALNHDYIYKPVLENFLVDAVAMSDKEIVSKLSRAGQVKLVLISGIFLRDPEARVDLVVVGDNLKQGTLDNVVAYIEAQLGKEIRYSSFETADFNYRLGIYDKLTRDIMERPHHKILNKLGL